MTSTCSSKSITWEELYFGALDESDEKLFGRLVATIKQAMLLRDWRLAHTSDNVEERASMKRAKQNLLFLSLQKRNSGTILSQPN
jgi:hypothetical protein